MKEKKPALHSQELTESIEHAYATAKAARQQFINADDLIVAMLEKSHSLPEMLKVHAIDHHKFREAVTAWISTTTKHLDGKDEVEVHPLPSFNRVITRATSTVQCNLESKREVLCVDVLIALFPENYSPSLRFLRAQGFKRQVAERYVKKLPPQ